MGPGKRLCDAAQGALLESEEAVPGLRAQFRELLPRLDELAG